ncbi:hypothetical protein [Paenibacillus sp. y28]|uniref:hypothetical protein n=1 Tax=Paenibacillus sp. y28 TaxID=3129110 RepID=UPI003018CB50
MIISTEKKSDFENRINEFISEFPYLSPPYNSRNYGHRWHSLCSYHGKLKPGIANRLIAAFTNVGDVVLDPMSGVGTIPFEACLQGRIGIGNDMSELAFAVTKAKVDKPPLSEVMSVLGELEIFINSFKQTYTDSDVPYKDFGLNKVIPEYFHEETYSELLAARLYFSQLGNGKLNNTEAMVLSCLLHVLHGNRPYALSRNSHPLTPYAPTGEFVYKNVIQHIRNKINLAYNKGEFEHYINGKAIFGNMFDLGEKISDVDVIITSPPFVDSIKFYSMNWMRLWFAGWEPEDFKKAESIFIEGQQKQSLEVYRPFFKMCNTVLKNGGRVIMHLGKSVKVDMAEELSHISSEYFETIAIGNEDVSKVEKHGIRDKGGTIAHQFLFLEKK